MGIWTEKATALKAAINKAGIYLTDEQALETTLLYPLFKAGLTVAIGDRYRDFAGFLYKCVQAHTTQDDWAPAITPALWTKISLDEWPQWVQPTGAQDAYNIGDKVTFESQHYISLIDTNTWSPTTYPAAWQLQS